MGRRRFFSHFLRNPRQVGSVTPSSRWLCRRLLGAAELSRCECVVEYGPGTACLTRGILERLPPGATLFAFEVNEEFVRALRDDLPHPSLAVVHDSAERVVEHLAAAGFSGADCVFSGIPFTTMPRDLRLAILRATHRALKPSGKFILYQYSPYLLGRLREVFGDVRVEFEPRNIPPAFCFVCSKRVASPPAS
ncbi:MAG: methyltransferase [bacterium]|nr:methyltransferase [bacterium]